MAPTVAPAKKMATDEPMDADCSLLVFNTSLDMMPSLLRTQDNPALGPMLRTLKPSLIPEQNHNHVKPAAS